MAADLLIPGFWIVSIEPWLLNLFAFHGLSHSCSLVILLDAINYSDLRLTFCTCNYCTGCRGMTRVREKDANMIKEEKRGDHIDLLPLEIKQ